MKIGLLPLYIKLYDDVTKDIRPRLEEFYEKVALEFESRGVEVVRSAFCRLKPEFEEAIRSFEAAGAAAIVTLHMAYSPSLESIEALCDTSLPIVVLDTTETEEFSPMQDSGEIMYCHGIHGVMDMCSLLSRHGVPYAIAAGHWKESDVIDRVCGLARAAAAARALAEAKVGLVGEAFAGMGDFRVAYSELAGRFGIRVDRISGEELRRIYDGVTDAEIAAEKAKNAEKYDFEGDMVEEEYTASVRSCIAVRKYVRQAALSALTVNFTRIGYNETGLTSMPFLACCEAMEEGIGYAGEGDVMTAALVGALLRGWDDVKSFSKPFKLVIQIQISLGNKVIKYLKQLLGFTYFIKSQNRIAVIFNFITVILRVESYKAHHFPRETKTQFDCKHYIILFTD